MKSVPVVLALGLSACVLSEPEPNVSVGSAALYNPHCDDWGCGTNSPYLGNRGFHYIYANKTQTPQGIKLTQFEKGGLTYQLAVKDGKITGTRKINLFFTTTIAGQSLVGAQLHLSYNGVEAHVIRIAAVQEAPMWAYAGKFVYVPTYVFEWLDPATNEFENMCTHPGDDDTLGMNEYATLVFEGDVIDEKSKTISPQVDNNVINFACAGSALAKLHLSGHTEVARRLGFETNAEQRTTILKMFVGDYCGTGKAFTVGGQTLQWADDKGWMRVTAQNADREALWTDRGAQCLNKPRLLANPPLINTQDFEDLEDQIAAECGGSPPSACAPDASAYEPDNGYHLISANP